MKTVFEKLALIIMAATLVACGGGGIGSSGQGTDPVVQDLPVAYVERALPVNDDGELLEDDLRNPLQFRPGARLFLKSQASPSASARNLTSGVFPAAEYANDEGQVLFDIRDLSVSYDGRRLLFAMRAPEIEDLPDDEQPTWNIWEYDLDTESLRRVISSDNTAEEGDDISPYYLADGRIVFTSTRQRQSKAILLDEGKPQYEALNEGNNEPALNIHVMTADGEEIEQLTFNQSHDLSPILRDNGKILFVRWNRAPGNDGMELYQVNPDGTELEILYGHHSHDTGSDDEPVQFARPMELEDGRILVSLRPHQSTTYGGDVVAVDSDGYTDHDQPVYTNLGATGSGQESLSLNEILTGEELNLSGRYAFASPLLDGTNRLLVSWSQCRLIEAPADDLTIIPAVDDDRVIYPCTQERIDSGDFIAAPPLYGLWILNAGNGTQLPILQPREGKMYTDAVIMQSRDLPTFIPDKAAGIELDEELVGDGYGIVHIRSVYDLDGVDTSPFGLANTANPSITPATARTARFLRVVKPVSRADRDVIEVDGSAFGRAGALRMREILGYVPIEPDGSVKFKVPANVAFAISILDADGRRISPQHHNWLQVKPGEEMECLGCHTSDSELPHGRYDAQAPSINSGAPTSGTGFPGADPALFADMGETMAETNARINGVYELDPDIVFEDIWSTTPVAPFSYEYANLSQPDIPIQSNCEDDWQSLCRIVINYETHIHPMWTVDRGDLDGLGAANCIACHNDEDDMSMPMIPAAQLDLSDGASDQDPDQFKAFRELLYNDAELEIDMDTGQLQEVMVQVFEDGQPVYETDADGNLVLDGGGNPIPVFTTVSVAPALRAGSANGSNDFFDLFSAGGSHAGWLTADELKLISEWVDIGAQYYNNPFDIPQD